MPAFFCDGEAIGGADVSSALFKWGRDVPTPYERNQNFAKAGKGSERFRIPKAMWLAAPWLRRAPEARLLEP